MNTLNSLFYELYTDVQLYLKLSACRYSSADYQKIYQSLIFSCHYNCTATQIVICEKVMYTYITTTKYETFDLLTDIS